MNKKLFIAPCVLLIQGCGAFYTQQTPAPIYDKTQTAKPYPSSVKTEGIKDTAKPYPNSVKTEGIKDDAYQTPAATPLVADQPLSPAVAALVLEAEQSSKAGDFAAAVAILERALRIDARNPRLTYKLAKLHLQRSKPRLAEGLAKKAVLLAAHDKALKRQSWLLISEARKQQNDFYGAKQAKLKADNF